MNIPQTITQGDSVSWIDEAWVGTDGQLYAPPDYTLTYALRGPGTPLDIVSAAQGTAWLTRLSAAASANLVPGRWWWSATAESGEVRATVSGQITVLRSLSVIDGIYDGRSQTEKDLAAVDAAISARLAGGAVAEYSVAGRSLKREPMAALLALRSTLLIRLRTEQGASRNLLVRFR